MVAHELEHARRLVPVDGGRMRTACATARARCQRRLSWRLAGTVDRPSPASATRGVGVNVTAGSSNNCRGRGPGGQEGRIVGNGVMFGEYGGAYEIMARGLQMVNYAWIKRIPPTALTQIYLEATGARSEIDLMEGLSNGQYRLTSFLTIQVMDTARAGDAAARDIFDWAGENLAAAISVLRARSKWKMTKWSHSIGQRL